MLEVRSFKLLATKAVLLVEKIDNPRLIGRGPIHYPTQIIEVGVTQGVRLEQEDNVTIWQDEVKLAIGDTAGVSQDVLRQSPSVPCGKSQIDDVDQSGWVF